MRFGDKLARLRGDRSYATVGEGCGCSGEHVRRLEKGTNPSMGIGLSLARYFAVPLDWLADDSQDWPPPQSDDQRAADLVKQALAQAGLAGELTRRERTLLAAIRGLPDAAQRELVGYVTGLAAAYEDAGAASEVIAEDLKTRLRESLAAADAEHSRRGPPKRRAKRK